MAAPVPGRPLPAAPPPPPPPRRAPVAGLLQALADLAGGDGEFLGTVQFQAPGCMRLVLDFEVVPAQAPAAMAGAPGSEARGRFMCRLVHATFRQHADWLAGAAAAPPRQHFHRLSSLHALPRRDSDSQCRFAAAVQSQAVTVQVDDQEFRVPVRAVLGHLPADHCRLVVRGLPAHCAVGGVTEALLQAAGYGAGSGVMVVHERAGVLAAAGLADDEEYGVPVFDTVVAVVLVPPLCAGLPMLPRTLVGGGWEATIGVETSVVPAGQLVLRQAAAPPPAGPLPAVPHPGVRPAMARVYAASGISSQAVPPAAAAAEGAARVPGRRTGLGFGPAVAAGGTQVHAGPGPSGPSRPPPLPPQEPMPPAAQVSSPPMDEPGFDAGCALVQDALDGCTAGDVLRVVLQARAAAPAAYAAASQVTSPSSLPRAFRAALYAQARLLVGVERAGPLEVPEAVDVGDLPGDVDALLGIHSSLPLGALPLGGGEVPAGVAALPCAVAAVCAVASPSPNPGRRSTRSSSAAGGRCHDGSTWLGLQRANMGAASHESTRGRGEPHGRGPA